MIIMRISRRGWDATEKLNVQSVEVKVDASLIEKLRAGYARARVEKACLPCPRGAGSRGWVPPERGYGPNTKGQAVPHPD